MISIENNKKKSVPPSQLPIVNVESSTTMQKPIKKAKKGEMVEEKKEKIIEDFILQKTPKPFDVAECKLMDKTIRGEYGDLFPFGNKPIMEVKNFVF